MLLVRVIKSGRTRWEEDVALVGGFGEENLKERDY
jgi:hypothetical protein